MTFCDGNLYLVGVGAGGLAVWDTGKGQPVDTPAPLTDKFSRVSHFVCSKSEPVVVTVVDGKCLPSLPSFPRVAIKKVVG